MTLRTILACLTDETSADSVMLAATSLARRHNAHLIGLHTIESLMVYPGIAMHIPDTVYTSFGESQMKQSAALKAIFERRTHAEDFVSEWRLLKSGTETTADRIVESARCADVVVMAAVTPETDGNTKVQLVETVIRDAGRPVIVVPSSFDADTLGQSILIGWNETREAARAAHDALNILQKGDTARILRVSVGTHDTEPDITTNDLAAAFDRHGIETTVVHKTGDQPSIAEALNKEAFEKGADMIAVGAFGHSRAYDFLIGAATRGLLRQSDLPVMFSR